MIVQYTDAKFVIGAYHLQKSRTRIEERNERDHALLLDEEEETEVSIVMITMKMPATTMTKTSVYMTVEVVVKENIDRDDTEENNGRDLDHRRILRPPKSRITIVIEDQETGREEDHLECPDEVGVEAIVLQNRNTIAKRSTIGDIARMMNDRIIIVVEIRHMMRQYGLYLEQAWSAMMMKVTKILMNSKRKILQKKTKQL